jgi:aryl-alcohol dehydrogenase-like predicted oxidoreductase
VDRVDVNRESEATTRRRFLGGVAAAAAGVISGCESRQESPVSGPLPSPEKFPRRPFGRRETAVPILQMGGDYYYSPRLVQRCLELGVRWFDTADDYAGHKSEPLLGSCLSKLKIKRESIFIATKAHTRQPGDILARRVPDSLRKLQTDYVDAWYVHDLDAPEVLASPEWKAVAAELIRSGKARSFGVSCHNNHLIPVMNAAVRCGWVDAIMFRYNFRSYGDRTLNEAMDACHKSGIALIAMKTQASAVSFAERLDGFKKAGFSRHQAVLKAVWQDQRITAIVSAMPTVQMVEQNAAAACDRLSAAEAHLLRQHAIATAHTYCPGGCGGCRRECEAAGGTPLAVADILRYLMYHDSYGRRREARRLFAELPGYRRGLEGADLASAERACPNGLALTSLLPMAMDKLA